MKIIFASIYIIYNIIINYVNFKFYKKYYNKLCEL